MLNMIKKINDDNEVHGWFLNYWRRRRWRQRWWWRQLMTITILVVVVFKTHWSKSRRQWGIISDSFQYKRVAVDTFLKHQFHISVSHSGRTFRFHIPFSQFHIPFSHTSFTYIFCVSFSDTFPHIPFSHTFLTYLSHMPSHISFFT